MGTAKLDGWLTNVQKLVRHSKDITLACYCKKLPKKMANELRGDLDAIKKHIECMITVIDKESPQGCKTCPVINSPKEKKIERMTLTVTKLHSMSAESKDDLPGPADHNGVRKHWVGIGWICEGQADGTEPLLIVDD